MKSYFEILDDDICDTQKDIYKYAANLGYDMNVFSREYLHSDFCKREMDSIYSHFQYEFPNECMDFILPEIGERLAKKKNTQEEVTRSGYVGYMYRKLFIETSISSAELSDRIPYEEMCKLCCDFDQRGDEETLADIIAKYGFELKRYDRDAKILTAEEMRAAEEADRAETARLTALYIK